MRTQLELILDNIDKSNHNLSYIELKKIKLDTIARYTINNSKYSDELIRLMKALKISQEQIIDSFIRYNLDIRAYGNEIYQSIAERFVMYIHKLIKNSWHEAGQKVLMEFVNHIHPKTIADIGFGVPSLYIREAIKKQSPKITLFDLYDSAIVFAKKVLSTWDSKWQHTVTFRKTDMDSFEFVGNFDLYIFQETIEHVGNPENYLKKYMAESHRDAKFFFSMPIGPLIPSHFISWKSKSAALCWLKKIGLKIIAAQTININPAIDLFANDSGLKFSFLAVLCEK